MKDSERRALIRLGFNEALRHNRATNPTPAITLYRNVKVNQWFHVSVGEWGGFIVQIRINSPYHDRVVLAPKDTPTSYPYGWLYPKGIAPLIAVLAWDPQTQAEPHGFLRRTSMRTRRAGEHADGAHHPIG